MLFKAFLNITYFSGMPHEAVSEYILSSEKSG